MTAYLVRRLDDGGARTLIGFEGLILHEYRDVANIATVCVGHVVRPEDAAWLRDGVTRAECDAVLKRDVARFEDAINRLVTVELSQPQMNALVSLTFNIGVYAFETSTVLRELNAGHYESAADAFLLWRYAHVKQKDGTYLKKPVLLGRRAAEAQLFRSGNPGTQLHAPDLESLLAAAQASLFDLRGLLDDRGLPVPDNDVLSDDGRLVARPPEEEDALPRLG